MSEAVCGGEGGGKGGMAEGDTEGDNVPGVGVRRSERRRIPVQRERETSGWWGVITVMQLGAKRGHVCAADSLAPKHINIL